MNNSIVQPDTRLAIRLFQRAVHETILRVGGYWHPAAATARLLEEIGEVNDLFLRHKNGELLRNELCDVLIISTCVANQYCVMLDDWEELYAHPEVSTQFISESKRLTGEWIGHLCVLGGQIGRMVNAYEGVKLPKATEDLRPVGYWIAALHGHLLALTRNQGYDLLEIATKLLEEKTHRDKGRFACTFDPITSAALERFQTIKSATRCPFAAGAKVWGSPTWDRRRSIAGNIELFIPTITRFSNVQRWDLIDGLVLELTDEALFSDLKSFKASFREILIQLNTRDPTQRPLFAETVESETWQFEFNGVPLFIVAFAPFYGADSPRETYGLQSAYIFFQPEKSFRELKIPRGGGKAATRESIRQTFADAGKPYDSPIMRAPFEAPRYLKPLHLGEPPVRWWEKSDSTP